MRGTQTHVGEESVFELALEVREGRADDQASQGVPDERHFREALNRAELLDVLLDLVGQSLSHLKDISFGEVFVGLARQEYGFGVCQTQVILEQAHIARITLETMTQHEEVNTTIHRELTK